jgi:hypothetical protein
VGVVSAFPVVCLVSCLVFHSVLPFLILRRLQ